MEEYNKLTSKMAVNLANPRSWVASYMPAVFGCAYSFFKGYDINILKIILLIAIPVLLQSAVNTLNDYFDFISGNDTAEDNLEASDAVLLVENINPKDALKLGIFFIAEAAALGVIVLILCKSFIPLFVGIIGVFCVVFYSGGKSPISYLPIGEFVSGFVMGGLIPLGCVAATSMEWHFEVLIYSIPFIISIGLILLSNNTCDIEKDEAAGRKTMPVLKGRKYSKRIFNLHIILWLISLLILPVFLIRNMVSGFLCIAWGYFLGRKTIKWLLSSPLTQETRIMQIVKIVSANQILNTVYIIIVIIFTNMDNFHLF